MNLNSKMRSNPISRKKKLFDTIIQAGLIAGTLDITAACISTYIRSGKPPAAVFRYIAAAAFGKPALQGGWDMIIAGLLFHYLIAFVCTITFFTIYPLVKKRIGLPVMVTGMLYGIVIWLFMNLLVLPLSALAPVHQSTSQIISGICFLVFLIGLPVSLFAARYYRSIITTAAPTEASS